jgi:DNA helicase IV
VAELGVGGFLTPAELARRYHGDLSSGEAPDEPRTFGHVLVDEAQDISAMQWRMLARRCPTGSMTVVGDFGQASRPGALRDWDEVLAVLPERGDTRVVTLTVNYRTPAEIMQVAQRVLAAAAPQVPQTEAVRRTGEEPRFVAVDRAGLVAAAGRQARDASSVGGTVAVIAPSALHRELVAELADVGARADTADALDARVAILTATDAKGLEFDHVIVVEPSRLVNPDASGMRLLYMALTRATRQLVIVHAEALPEALASAALHGAPIAAS